MMRVRSKLITVVREGLYYRVECKFREREVQLSVGRSEWRAVGEPEYRLVGSDTLTSDGRGGGPVVELVGNEFIWGDKVYRPV